MSLFWFFMGGVVSLITFLTLVLYIFSKIPYKFVLESKTKLRDSVKSGNGMNGIRTPTQHMNSKEGNIKISHSVMTRAELGWDKLKSSIYLNNLETHNLNNAPESQTRRIFSSSLSLLTSSKDALSKVLFDTNAIPSKMTPDSTSLDNDAYAVIDTSFLLLYDSSTRKYLLKRIDLSHFTISLFPTNLPDFEIYLCDTPIHLIPLDTNQHHELFIYVSSGIEKEDWYLLLRRASMQETEPQRAYIHSMTKLLTTLSHTSPKHQSMAWLNALVGRMFVGIHSSPRIKAWLMQKINRHSSQSTPQSTFLTDIDIQEIDVGNSVPVFTNPKLIDVSIDGDMNIAMDIDYTGGICIKAATHACISVPSLTLYMKPLNVPIVVSVKINHFSARVLFKIKPFWESGRIWFGFYNEPAIELGLDVVPIISNKLVKLELVNQIIEARIKDALNAFVVLPNMDDLPFWPADGVGGIFADDVAGSEEEYDEDEEDASVVFDDDALDDIGGESTLKSFLDSSEESLPGSYMPDSLSDIFSRSMFVTDPIPIPTTPDEPELTSQKVWDGIHFPQTMSPYLKSTFNSAYLKTTIDTLSQQATHYEIEKKFKNAVKTAQAYGLDDTANSIAETAKNVGSGVLDYIQRHTPKKAPPPTKNLDSIAQTRKVSTIFEMFGVSIVTSPPVTPGISPSKIRNGMGSRRRESGVNDTSERREMLKRRSISLSTIIPDDVQPDAGKDGLKKSPSRSVSLSTIVPDDIQPDTGKDGLKKSPIRSVSLANMNNEGVTVNLVSERNSVDSNIFKFSDLPVQSSTDSFLPEKPNSNMTKFPMIENVERIDIPLRAPTMLFKRRKPPSSESLKSLPEEMNNTTLLGMFSSIRQASMTSLFGSYSTTSLDSTSSDNSRNNGKHEVP